jgi:ATP-binding cassette subfamily A (ABC1) protein 3
VTVVDDTALLLECPSSLRGATACFAGVNFHSSPSQGGIWNYTLRGDGALGSKIYVDRTTNDQEVDINGENVS